MRARRAVWLSPGPRGAFECKNVGQGGLETLRGQFRGSYPAGAMGKRRNGEEEGLTRLYDRLQREKVAAFSPEYEPQWRQDLEEMRESPVVAADGVTRYFYEAARRDDWRRGEEIPNVAPPFERAFFETRAPGEILDSRGRPVETGDSIPKAWGMFMRSTDLKKETGGVAGWREVARDHLERTLEQIGTSEKLATDVRWFLQFTLYVEDAPWARHILGRGIVGPLAYMFLGVQEDGTLAGLESGNRARGVVPLLGEAGKRSPELVNHVGYNAAFLFNPICLSIAFANCRNVALVEVSSDARKQRRAVKKRKRPLTRYHILEIETMKEVLEREGRVSEVGVERALHLVRGHWRIYTPERGGPFGKDITEPVLQYVSPHARGEAKFGEVTKDYHVGEPQGEPNRGNGAS